YWCADGIESLGLALSVIEQRVVSRIQPSRYWKTPLLLDSDPVPKLQPHLPEIGTERNVPFWQIVQEERPAGLQHTLALGKPAPGPSQILVLAAVVRTTSAVLLTKVEWGIGEHRIDRPALQCR